MVTSRRSSSDALLSSVIHIPAHSAQAVVLRWSLERFAAEVRSHHAGRALMLRHLAPIMLVQTLRSYLASARGEKNWFVALSDPRLSRAIGAMQSEHRAPLVSSTIWPGPLGSPRAGFALNFKKWIGVTPMEYLTQWRVQLACELLREADRRIAEVASEVGYESESAFSVAFTRIVGCRPGHYQRRGAEAVKAGGGGRMNHAFWLVRAADHPAGPVLRHFLSLPPEVEIHDVLIRYMNDTLRWIPARDPRRGEPCAGLDLYGPTCIHTEGARVARAVFSAWAALYVLGPEMLDLTGTLHAGGR